MIHFFRARTNFIYALEISDHLSEESLEKLTWLLDGNSIGNNQISSWHRGPRKEMITPWSTNAVEITQNMGIGGILRIEKFYEVDEKANFDPMLEQLYNGLDQDVFTIDRKPEPVQEIDDIASYNLKEGLALSQEEVTYLENVSLEIGRKLTDGEVFGFSQVNSEHCRHKIFNGTFIIDDEVQASSLFSLIRKTSSENKNGIVSAYKDNVAFVRGPVANQFAPARQDTPDYFQTKAIDTVLSLKAETHNFPTTVEPFNGAATGSGGEIRDRMAGGIASIPLAGTAVYMTSYPRSVEGRLWEKEIKERPWLYQTPMEILIKASNGASDFGNKFGQPLIAGSVLTFEHPSENHFLGFDKVIMLAGGIGFGKLEDSLKKEPEAGDKIVLLGGDNYRIGMGGGSVSSVATGEFQNSIELNAIQRSNPEMQKRVYNAIRAMSELDNNPLVSLHDHGAGGHLNCLSELVENSGGAIEVDKLPVGDPTLSAKEIIGNESQERMGMVVKPKDIDLLQKIADRERAPMYVVGQATDDMVFKFESKDEQNPIDLKLSHFFGSSPKTVLTDKTIKNSFSEIQYEPAKTVEYIENVLQLEAVACKDWLTNKVDRSVTGKVATQQCTGQVQLPLNNVGVMAISYDQLKGVATSIGHAPIPALVNVEAGSRLSIAEALTNIIWTPLENGIKSISLSANWMWPTRNDGENARLYAAVQAVSEFAISLGINIPTGKDSLSMTQKYPNGDVVISPGTVIISAVGEVSDITKTVSPTLSSNRDGLIWLLPFSDSFELAGSSFAQLLNTLGTETPDIQDAEYFVSAFDAVQGEIKSGNILAGHDVSSGGLITTLLEMTFSMNNLGMTLDLAEVPEKDLIKILFSESPALILQMEENSANVLISKGVRLLKIGTVQDQPAMAISHPSGNLDLDVHALRDLWFKSSFLMDKQQTKGDHAQRRQRNFGSQPLEYSFPTNFSGSYTSVGLDPLRVERTGTKAAIIREKGVNGDREMAYALHLAGFDVKDVHMTDLISGRENLQDIEFIVFVGGFSNSDVLGSAKGWAGAFLYNKKAKAVLDEFYARPNTLSLGVCNGCQLMMELGLVYPQMNDHPKMLHNDSGKFESSFLNVTIEKNTSVMLGSLSGTRLGIWVAHGEGKFNFKEKKSEYNIVGTYSYSNYPGNPNGSDFDAAIVVSANGRHMAMMPHLERSILTWQWPYHSADENNEVTPWIEAFVNARKWVQKNIRNT